MTTTPHQNSYQSMVGEELEHWDSSDWYEDYDEWIKRKKEEEQYTNQELVEDRYLLSQNHYENELADDSQFMWQDMIDELTQFINERNPDGWLWYCTTRNLGWRHRDGGYKTFSTAPQAGEKEGNVFLRAILPDTECTFHIYDYSSPDGTIKGLAIRNSHHDAMNEWYYCIPASSDDDDE